MRDMAKVLAEAHPDQPTRWVNWAFALRELGQVEKAKNVAVRGLELHPDAANLHYNLACYLSLMGEFQTANEHLRRTCKADDRFKLTATEDKDLARLWAAFGKEDG